MQRRVIHPGLLRLLAAMLLAILWGWAAGPGFRTDRHWDDHYRKHGAEFGRITKAEYLRLAQQLRDAPLSEQILQSVRRDGVRTRFDRQRGHFGAYNPDRTIRTFFIPNDGERYFQRQAQR